MFTFGWELGSDDSSEEKDQDPNAYKWKSFVVVKAYVNNKDRYDCIPSKWLVFDKESGRGYQTTVTYRFPPSTKLGSGFEFRKNHEAKSIWPKYNGKMLLETDSKEQAFKLINSEKERTRKLLQEAGDSYSSTSKLDLNEGKKTPEKSGTKRTQIEQDNINIPAKTKKNEDESVKKNDSEKIELPKELHAHCKNFYDEINATYQKSMWMLDNTADYLQKIISIRKAKLAPLPTSQKLDDTTGTKWTLRHHEPSPGVVELSPKTGVYVSEKGLNECKINCTASTEFTRALLAEVFTDEALRKCSYTGQPPRNNRDSGHAAKPGLDLNARQTLVDYCLKYSGEKGWCYGNSVKEDTDRIINSIKGKLYELYQKSK